MRDKNRHELSRRRFLRSAALLVPVLAWPGIARTATPARRLGFYHTHTSETLDIVYSENGIYVPGALTEIDYLFRDFRSGDVHAIDPGLLDLLHDVQQATGRGGRFEIISAYRSPQTNRMLAQRGGGVSDRSLHLTGQAIDVRLPGVRTADLQRVALKRAGGGVGYYPESDFVHIDTGRVRRW
ncbi:MAG: DUF882 domain-containing protein [Gammaproteobacteria bacterium]|nr:DUF882 domain-containing protein [Gammaproteobacteria bacterium]MDH5275158.1 DUF882 domain-containing protein [Gammaproteobacteria bacterium]